MSSFMVQEWWKLSICFFLLISFWYTAHWKSKIKLLNKTIANDRTEDENRPSIGKNTWMNKKKGCTHTWKVYSYMKRYTVLMQMRRNTVIIHERYCIHAWEETLYSYMKKHTIHTWEETLYSYLKRQAMLMHEEKHHIHTWKDTLCSCMRRNIVLTHERIHCIHTWEGILCSYMKDTLCIYTWEETLYSYMKRYTVSYMRRYVVLMYKKTH